MPKDTFFNLREEKQQRILDAVLREISARGYEKASVTRIVKDAGIATGSFYQYFEDLADVFVYIGQQAARMKAEYMYRELEQAKEDGMEALIRAMYRGGLRFGLEHEKYFRAAQSFIQVKDTELYRRMFEGVNTNERFAWVFQRVGQAIQQGNLPAGMTTELFFKLITSINTTIFEHLIAAKSGREMDAKDLETLSDMSLHILLHGIQKRDN